jgi:hypothetical protein
LVEKDGNKVKVGCVYASRKELKGINWLSYFAYKSGLSFKVKSSGEIILEYEDGESVGLSSDNIDKILKDYFDE